jgi:hypothetical protein
MKTRKREIGTMVRAAGLLLVDLFTTGGNHFAGRLKAGDGTERQFIFAKTPSDRRGDLNRLSHLRRFANEHGRVRGGVL